MQAAQLAQPDGLVLPIAGYGASLLPVLERLYATSGRRNRAWPDALATLAAQAERQVAIYGEIRGNKARHRPERGSEQSAVDALNLKSRQMLRMIAQGRNNAEIARALGVKPVTVAKTLGIIYRTLGVRNRSEAVCTWSRYEECSLDAE